MRSLILTLAFGLLVCGGQAIAQDSATYTGVGKLLVKKEVQDELKLSNEQLQKTGQVLRNIGDKYKDSFAELAKVPRTERLAKYNQLIDEMNAETFKGLKDILDAKQMERLRQLDRRSQGLRVIHDPEVLKELKLTNEQQTKLAEISEAASKEIGDILRANAGDRAEGAKKVAAAQKRILAEILDMFTEEQKQTWKKLTGELPIDKPGPNPGAALDKAKPAGRSVVDSLDANQRQRAQRGFALLDTDADGKVLRKEFTKLGDYLPQVKDAARADVLFKLLDKNGDGSLSLEEYAGIMLLKPASPVPAPEPAKPESPPTKPAATRDASMVRPPTAEQLTFFEKNIRPVLADKCYKCHAADSERIQGGLVLDTREGIRQGGDTGPAVVPGDVAKSLLIEALRYGNKDLQMPPEKSGGKVADSVIADFEQWVQMGAPDPREGKAAVAASSWDTTKARDHWAFKAPKRQPPPAVKDAAWPRTDLDRFILAGLESKGLMPVGDADKRALLRRVSFDLTGLPPTPEEAEAYLADTSPQAFDRVVDRLLKSPRFGEHWGRHWLDVARYAESTGRDVNSTLPHAWRYRDYVIASFNADKPYDQFIREQIAGDLLPAKDDRERAEHIIATGFLALGSRNLNERNSRQFVLDMADEQVDTMSQAVLGLTVACARCHDHKFDPIPQRDYYALAGIFLSTDTRYGTAPTFEAARGGKLIELPEDSSLPRLAKTLSKDARARLERDLAEARKASDLIYTGLYGGGRKGPEGGINNDPKALVQVVAVTARMGQLERELAAYDAEGRARLLAMGVQDLPTPDALKSPSIPRSLDDLMEGFRRRPAEFAAISDSPLFARGDAAKPGEIVPRGFLSVLTVPATPIAKGQSGRKELAEWLVEQENPLTARVFANRVWHWLFGRGIVESVDNFGTTGQVPSSAALLDYLALRLQESKWSVKSLIRDIVTSRFYQLAASYDEQNFLADPENVLVWRHAPRRLEAESIRDAMLAVSGGLRLDPPVGSAVALAGDGALSGRKIRGLREPLTDEAFVNFGGDFRSIYLPVPRNAVPDALAVFDFAEPNSVAGRRDTTTVPSQALYLLNSDFVTAQANRLAEKLIALPPAERTERAFLLAFARQPTASERKAAEALFAGYHTGPKGEKAAWTGFCRALFGSAEFRLID